MKVLTVLNLSAAAFVCLGMSLGSANDQTSGQCIRLHSGGLDFPKPYAATVEAHTQEALTGAVGHVLGYVDQEDAGLDLSPKQLLILPTTSGRYVLRIRDLPSGLGLHGPFW